MAKKIYIGADHNGFDLKEELKKYLDRKNIAYIDVGNKEFDSNDDYPDFASLVAKAVSRNKTKGILVCGSGQGVCIVANKFKGVRAVNVNSLLSAKYSRIDDDANILCLSAGKKGSSGKLGVNKALALRIVNVWLNTKFSQAARHKRRLNKIKKIESQNLK